MASNPEGPSPAKRGRQVGSEISKRIPRREGRANFSRQMVAVRAARKSAGEAATRSSPRKSEGAAHPLSRMTRAFAKFPLEIFWKNAVTILIQEFSKKKIAANILARSFLQMNLLLLYV